MAFFSSTDVSTLRSAFTATKVERDRASLKFISDAVSKDILSRLEHYRETIMSDLQQQMKDTYGSFVTVPIWTFQTCMWNTPPPWTLTGSEYCDAFQARREALEKIHNAQWETICEDYEHNSDYNVLIQDISMSNLVRRSDVLDRLSNGFGLNFRVSWERGDIVHSEDEFTLYQSRILLHYYPKGRPAWYIKHLAKNTIDLVYQSNRELNVRGLYRYVIEPPMTPPLRPQTPSSPPRLMRSSAYTEMEL